LFLRHFASLRVRISIAVIDNRRELIRDTTDTKGTPQFGLIAEEVAKVNPALVLPDKEGKPYTVRYDAVNAILLNELPKEHSRVQELEATVAQQRKDSEATALRQQKEIELLYSGPTESERPAGTEQTFAAKGAEQSLRLIS
jgi:hypothetical protein